MKARIKVLVGLLISCSLMVLFQNCSNPTSGSSQGESSGAREVNFNDNTDAFALPEPTGGTVTIDDVTSGEGDNGVVPVTAPDGSLEIISYYQQYLGREPEQSGFDYYMAQYASGRPLSEIENEIANSVEANIRNSYLDHLGREPEAAGMEFYRNAFLAGTSLDDIDQNIMNSPEAQIRQIYLDVLMREPDAPGMEFWIGEFNNGMSIEDIRANISISEEAQGL